MNRLVVLLFLISCAGPKKQEVIQEVSLGVSFKDQYPEYLSEWNLVSFEDNRIVPGPGVIPYDINAALFSDYAHKARFFRLPKDSMMTFDDSEVFEFPVGSVLVKNFYYPADFRDKDSQKRMLETRLLIRDSAEWNAIVYQWNDDQTEARRLILGDEVPVEWTDKQGLLQRINYSIPSQPQCKSCHELNGKLVPIGPTARQLSHDGQLEDWVTLGMLDHAGIGIEVLKDYYDRSWSIDDRARAWLEVNCAHCHRREGPAKNSGLFLLAAETDPYRLGVGKPPVAAGKGSGGLIHGIVPGAPEKSILMHRIESLEPGEMMPELGRKLRHEEGIELIREWIREMKLDGK